MKRAGFVFAGKCAALALLDMGSVLLLISVWRVFQSPVYVWAMLSTLVVLFLVDTLVLIAPHLRRVMRQGSTVSLLLVTGFYYVLHMVFTGLAYAWMPPLWYGMVAVLLLVTYALCLFMLYRSGRTPAAERPRTQGDGARQLQSRAVPLLQAAHDLIDDLGAGRQAESLRKAYADMRRQMEFATPFGRCPQPVILDMEQAILQRVERLTSLVEEGRTQPGDDALNRVVAGFMELSMLLKNREKLILGEYAGESV